MILRYICALIFLHAVVIVFPGCSKKSSGGAGTVITPPPPAISNDVDCWMTTGDRGALLQKQTSVLSFITTANIAPFIDVDTTQVFQTIDGFGYCLTGGSAYVINHLSTVDKGALLNELFGTDVNSIGVSYLRISMGASDLDATVFSYDDMPAGQTDTMLNNFTLNPDRTDLIPLLKQILMINPSIKILATPWSAPLWMKDNGNTMGGNLLPQYYGAYARYFVKYIQQMKAEGINIDAVTPQNEPLNAYNEPSMLLPVAPAISFIKNNLGPAFQSASLTTKIIVYDHNCDHPEYPINVMNDAGAKFYINGSAFHLYAGDISALSTVHNTYPDKQVYFTEQWTASTGGFDTDLKWHLKNVIIGAMRNWSKNALEWNLANDPYYGPHTPGGCSQCKGALTIGAGIIRNVGYYIVAQASKFVPAGSVRIGSTVPGNLNNVAFKTPAGKKVLIVENDGSTYSDFNIRFNNKWVSATIPAGAVATYVW